MEKSPLRIAMAIALGLSITGTAMAAGNHQIQAAVDMGSASANGTTNVTLILKLRNREALAQYIRDTVTPGSPHFQQFLTTSQFASRYGATPADIARVQAWLKQQGLSSTVMANHLAIRTSGTMQQFETAFRTSVHTFTSRATGRRFHRPLTQPLLPTSIADLVAATTGLNTQRTFHSHRIRTLPLSNQQQTLLPLVHASSSGNPTATGQPGSYTVGDVADMYDINPLYKRGITGAGSTVAIVTLSNFYPSDATTYWNDIGLTTKPDRITQVHVDGGAPIDSGSGETALDVEQSGGIAPDANIIVYDAPNAGNGFIDAFAQAVSDNKADSISTSWGAAEMFNFAALNVSGARDTDTSDAGDLRAFHEILMEAAAQGQSVFAAAGDSGAYDTVRALGFGGGPGEFNSPLSVDSPASDPYITAAGGTTVPYSFSFAGGPTASVTQESVWGWDYLQTYLDTNAPTAGGWHQYLFSVGGGGGVSVYWRTPFYQMFTRGIRRSEKGQTLTYNDPSSGLYTWLKLPGNFRGRNVPDISLNADPETGYIVVSTYDGGLISEGGTSFVAPQLNGISALLSQSLHHRVGFWNPQLYFLQNVFGYGPWSAFHAVNAGDNWFYQGAPHYTPGAGLGTLDVANFDQFLKSGL
ncbi:S53 family serine peptidase [Dyella sp. A6]|uniref:S53 family peptidase n=1 Tax=Dyella aluminiiresistens TaxID=3069105 RepID=UPI002E763364|nr:S53 family serine peptidase [Dyella sp. A6]